MFVRAIFLAGTCALLAAPLHARAGDLPTETTTKSYLVTRDKAIAYVNNASSDTDAFQKSAVKKLDGMLRTLIGPMEVTGFTGAGEFIDPYLEDWPTYRPVDGLVYTAADGSQSRLVVTTRPILEAWLLKQTEETGGQAEPPAAPEAVEAALADGGTYAGALNNDAAVYTFAPLPIANASPGRVAKALLFEQGQDDVTPNPPDQIGVAILQGGRVYILTQPASVTPIPACKALYERNPSNGETTFEQCYARLLPKQADFARLVKQAQALADRVRAN